MRNKSQSENRFFLENTIRPCSILVTHSSQELKVSRTAKTQKPMSKELSKQSEKYTNTVRTYKSQSARLNPKNFVHREVFNSTLYKQIGLGLGKEKLNVNKFFNIHISKEQRASSKLGDEEGIYLKSLANMLSHSFWYEKYDEMKKVWRNIQHNLGILEKYIRCVEDSNPVKYAIKHTIQSIEYFLLLAVKKIDKHELSKMNCYNKTSASYNRERLSPLKTYIKNYELLVESSLKLKQEKQYNATIAKLKSYISALDFCYKKKILENEKLHEQISYLYNFLKIEIEEKMTLIKYKASFYKVEYGYKNTIVKLKYQIHILEALKYQTLGDKLKYILNDD